MSHRPSRKRKKRGKKVALATTVSIVVLSLLGFLFFSRAPLVNSSQAASMFDGLAGKGIVIHQETVISAVCSGAIERLIQPGQRISRGQAVVNIIEKKGDTLQMTAPAAGLLSFDCDGLEELFKEPVLNALGNEIFSYRPRQMNQINRVKAGDPVYKLLHNFEPTRLLVQGNTPSQWQDLHIGSRGTIVGDGKILGPAEIIDCSTCSDMQIYMFAFTNFKVELMYIRYMDIKFYPEPE